MEINDSQIAIALLIAIIPGLLALNLAKDLYK